MDYVALAVPFFLLALFVELIYGWVVKNNTYRINDTISSLFMGSLRGTSKVLGIGFAWAVWSFVETHFALWSMDTSSVFTWVFSFVIYDLFYYLFHRYSHERQIFWASHVAHHHSEEYNLSTALRQTGTGFFIKWVFYIPLFVIGMPSEVFLSVASINLIYQFWVHTQHIPKLGWYELFFVTPSNHRVHHSQNDLYIDRNYGGVFIIWDRIFGTFQEEQDSEPCVYGIRSSINTFNPVKANLHIYSKILGEIKNAKSWKDKLYSPFARTGWEPGLPFGSTKTGSFDTQAFSKHDPEISISTKFYAFIQFLMVTVFALFYLDGGDLTYEQSLAALVLVIFTMFCITQWLDGFRILILEASRLLLVLSAGFLLLQQGEEFLSNLLFGYAFLNLLVLPFLPRNEQDGLKSSELDGIIQEAPIKNKG